MKKANNNLMPLRGMLMNNTVKTFLRTMSNIKKKPGLFLHILVEGENGQQSHVFDEKSRGTL
ncbi:MAG: hypothetical protein QS748_14135 [Candidatus Endonucleobacter bathymodioli]|uniref:Uncharacterized protein n=1 Tax=Candidatus Endonucleibacter bathymodioli TaxID=539814 RepID=A0AA90NNV5_9GAMM|nr:hypothetical protein [Candidatus Endonucleobacter bathymodioli]